MQLFLCIALESASLKLALFPNPIARPKTSPLFSNTVQQLFKTLVLVSFSRPNTFGSLSCSLKEVLSLALQKFGGELKEYLNPCYFAILCIRKNYYAFESFAL